MNWKFLTWIGLTLILLAACSQGDNEHHEPRGNLQRTAVYDVDAVGLTSVVWQVEAGTRVVAAPAVSRSTAYWAGRDGRLRATDLDDGDELWQLQLDGSVLGSPVLFKGRIYVATIAGTVYSVKDGKVLHRIDVGEAVTTAPLVYGDQLVVGCKDGSLRSFNLGTGDQRWLLQTGRTIKGNPALVNGILYVSSNDGLLRAVDMQRGTVKWQFVVGRNVEATPAVADGVVYIGSSNRVFYAVDAESGKRLWRFRAGNEVRSSAAVTESLVLFGCDNSTVYALDRQTGRAVWQVRTRGMIDASPVVAGQTVYFGSRDKHVYSVALESGKILDKWSADSWVIADPVPTRDGLLVATRGGNLVLFN